ncbi:helix-turn-helix domain-containing protein, partial [Rhodococcus sp. T2V]|uniref:helix-turn-helix domain-containing protein n=1 Tax=Rhodococcus sp. T2V TaxID=3034164 RepID=UPI0023E2586F
MGILGSPAAGTYLPDEDLPAARELGRRLGWCAKHLGVLPGPTPARTGAAIVDKIKRERTRSGKGLVVATAGPVPPLDGAPRGDLEPAVGFARRIGRDPGTISRELRRNAATRGGKPVYRALVAQWKAQQAAKRPKAAKLVGNDRLRKYVQERLSGNVRRPDGTIVRGPKTPAWKGLNKPHRQDRPWA